ncbi:MAG: hypothetical protein O7A03_02435 [Alphaproteobacteria bacterium]|nr:hypothetical protein [Alphaproteobacteria bacterium]
MAVWTPRTDIMNVEAPTRIADRHYVVWRGNSTELIGAPEIQHRYLAV